MSGAQITGLSPQTGHGIAVRIKAGRIAAITAQDLPEGSPYLARGLVDLQVNGYGGVDFNAGNLTPLAARHLCQTLAALGVTRFLATVITASPAAMAKAIADIAAARRAHPLVAQMICGLHIEGPSISRLDGPRGAHPLAHVRAPELAEFDQWQQLSGDLVRLVTLAPEQDESGDYIRAVSARGVIVAIGHSAASPAQIAQAVAAGARMSTHLGNGVAGQLPRHPNLIWAQLAEDRLTAGLIADGHHLSPETFRAMLRAKGPGRAVLVSDTVALAGGVPGIYSQAVGDAVELTTDGRIMLSGTPYLAGAATPLADAVPRAARMAGIPLAEALDLASTTPAKLLGRAGLELGAEADLIQFYAPQGQSLQIQSCWVGGEKVI